MSYIALVLDVSQYSAVKTLRICRVLKLMKIVSGLKVYVEVTVYSIKNLKDVIVLMIFILGFFSLLGMQLYMGVLTRICIVDFDPVDISGVINETTPDSAYVNVVNWIERNGLLHWKRSRNGTGQNGTITWNDWVKNSTTWYVTSEYSSHSDGYISCNNGSGTGSCPLGTTCVEVPLVLFLQPHTQYFR